MKDRLIHFYFGLACSNPLLQRYIIDWDLHISLQESSNAVSSPQVHQRLKRFSVARFTFIRIVTLTGLSEMLAINLCRNYPGPSN